MPPEKSPADKPLKNPRIPEPSGDIQVNACKNPRCPNFNVPAIQREKKKGGDHSANKDPHYKSTSVGAKAPGLECLGCGEVFAVKSNAGIASEVDRISSYLNVKEPSCGNEACPHHGLGLYSHPDAYYKFGKTKKGTPRYRCKADGCGKTLTIPASRSRKQADPHLNIILFKLLMNKMPLGRILEITEIKKPTLYRRIDFFHIQCMKFIGEREHQFLTGEVAPNRLYLSTDRQVYHSNWRSARIRRHVQFSPLSITPMLANT